MNTPVTFASLALSEPLQRALADKNYTIPSPIQAQAIPHLLEGRDLIGCAQTGTGKTAAFALPTLHKLSQSGEPARPKRPRALILTPTRELASQIGQNFEAYGRYLNLRHLVVFGGVGQNPQVRGMTSGIDILVATPGRLLDLQQQGHIKLDQVEIFVLDEADRMLDMGFVHDVKKVIAQLPAKRQSLLFSATMPPPIQQLADTLLDRPVRVEVTPVATTAERIRQHLCHVDRGHKRDLLLHFLEEHPKGLVLVFVKMKHAANRLVEQLSKAGVQAAAIHGNKSQSAREKALEGFRQGRNRVLVATDIAARGIDVKGITLVVNFDIPNEPESYVHRIGRTARAGAEGMAIAFCEPAERGWIRDIEKLIRQEIPVITDHPFPSTGRVEEQSAPSRPHRRPDAGRRSQPGRSDRNDRSGQTQNRGRSNRRRR